jgi:hypothetical protein
MEPEEALDLLGTEFRRMLSGAQGERDHALRHLGHYYAIVAGKAKRGDLIAVAAIQQAAGSLTADSTDEEIIAVLEGTVREVLGET